MSYGGRVNPDTRPLPPGWREQYDSNYNAWFYVDTNANPPRTTWEHPVGRHDQFIPPPGPPPARAVSPYGGGYNQPQGYGDSYAPSYGRGPSPAPPVPYGGRPGYQDEQRGLFGGGSSMPPQVIEQVAPQKHHWGMGTKIAAGGAGIVGGLLLADGIEHLEEHHDAYEQQIGFQEGEQAGFQQGDMVGFQQGDQVGFDQGDQVGFDQGDQVGFDQGYVDGSIDNGW